MRGPIQRCVDFFRCVTRLKSKQRSIVLLRGAHNFSGIHQALRIEQRFDFTQCLGQTWPKKRRDPFAAYQAIAVFARINPLVFTHQFRGFFRDRAHFHRAVGTHVQYRSHVQRTDRRVRVPGALRTVFFKYFGKTPRVFGEMLQWHAAIFDEAHRLTVPAHRHQDVEARFAYVPQRFLRAAVDHFDDAIRHTEVRHHHSEIVQFFREQRVVVACKFHQQNRFRLPDQRRIDDRPERGIATR